MVGWHHRLDRHGFEQAPGVGGGQAGLACCGPWEEDPPEKGVATTHSTFLAGKTPWPEEPGGLPSMGSHRVGHA